MSTADLPIPADLLVDVPPLSDADLDRYFAVVEQVATDLHLAVDEAEGTIADSTAEDDAIARVARWRIEDLGTAAWAAARLAEAEAEIDALRIQSDEWAARIQLWFWNGSRRPERTAAFMRDRLADYGLRVRDETGQATVPLPSATIRTTASQPAVEIVDEAATAAWAEKVPDHVLADRLDPTERLLSRSVKVYIRALRKLCRIERADGADAVIGLDGEPVPGATVRPGATTATVTVNRS